MSELAADFQSLPAEYQDVLHLAQGQDNLVITPLQLLVGGWSGALVYLVSISSNETRRVEHCILKLDRKGKSAKSDGVTRHNTVIAKSTPEFARAPIAECIAGLASLRAKQGRVHAGATMLGAAEALLGESGATWWPPDRVEVDQTRLLLQSAMGEHELKQARAAGQAMGLEQAIAFVSDED
jgi:hypothetical protein